MTNRSKYVTNGKMHPENIPTVDKKPTVEERGGVVEKAPIRRETVTTPTSTPHSHLTKSKQDYGPSLPIFGSKVHPETIPTMEKTPALKGRDGVVEKAPIRRETVTTPTPTSHSHPTKSKQDYGPSLPILGAIACCIPLAGILGYLIHQPRERVVTRTVTNTVPVLTVPASPVVTPAPVYSAPPDVSSSAVGPAVVGPKVVGPGIYGPARVGVDRVGKE